MEFSYKILPQGNSNVIFLDGILNDKAQAQPLLDEIDQLILSNSNKFVISMKDSKYINSTGLNVLINILTKARKAGGDAIISDVPAKINELLLITKLNTVFTVTSTVDEAVLVLK